MTTLEDVEALRQLKYRYLRFLDLKQWDDLGRLFVDDATVSYAGGKLSYAGREAIMEFLVGALGRSSMLTSHHGHHPEIELTGPDSATGIWALEDMVIDLENEVTISGAAFYRDEYVRVQGDWRFQHTGYERVFEQVQSRKDVPGLQVTQNFFAGK